jgi:catechol 2,3-dioxygenase
MEQQSTDVNQTAHASINPQTHIGPVTLRVSDLDNSLAFYEEVLAFRRIDRTDGRATLGAAEGPALLELHEVPGAPPQPSWSTGLYHVAILLPTRADLGWLLMRMANAGLEIGQGDHLVSEALYISDPDENGLEVYRDRPREEWQWDATGAVKMATDPVDIQGLVDDARREGKNWDVLPAGTTVGHIHLQVADIPRSERFYHDILGFDITARWPSALFVSAGGYHHHIGMNTWQSRGAGPAPETSAGLQTFVIALPDQDALAEVRARLSENNMPFEERDNGLEVRDPWHNRVQLLVV